MIAPKQPGSTYRIAGKLHGSEDIQPEEVHSEVALLLLDEHPPEDIPSRRPALNAAVGEVSVRTMRTICSRSSSFLHACILDNVRNGAGRALCVT